MLQGVFVFIMAVCNRKVINTILGKRADRIVSAKISMKTLMRRSKSRDPGAGGSNTDNTPSSASRPSMNYTRGTELPSEAAKQLTSESNQHGMQEESRDTNTA